MAIKKSLEEAKIKELEEQQQAATASSDLVPAQRAAQIRESENMAQIEAMKRQLEEQQAEAAAIAAVAASVCELQSFELTAGCSKQLSSSRRKNSIMRHWCKKKNSGSFRRSWRKPGEPAGYPADLGQGREA